MAGSALTQVYNALAQNELLISAMTNDIANVHTIGYKPSQITIVDSFYQNYKNAGVRQYSDYAPTPSGVQVGTGAKILSIAYDFSIGTPKAVTDPLSFAIQGPGFVALNDTLSPNGRAYTRDCRFQIDKDTRRLVSMDGRFLSSDITVPVEVIGNLQNIEITPAGIVQANIPGVAEPLFLGQIVLYNFANLSGLIRAGNNSLYESPASGDAFELNPESYNISQFMVEGSVATPLTILPELVRCNSHQQIIQQLVVLNTEQEKNLVKLLQT
ncbi:Flagellar basal-body rod protein FlgG [Rickettsiales endosymbiont of Paramecium tredecaurelia]|uniref:flagellar hook-basal body protein n=1 Tax=Candidatus Sarmatiella mevalonica TaxID=2770581 RepID=UPI00192136DE|nr:hypothetical protein [Candidatus Sarmatiella mevalonica]MBL3284712.1 Flagellar basal-body rod protein FlgG [Candidatus Sarmatiella mevalonica]